MNSAGRSLVLWVSDAGCPSALRHELKFRDLKLLQATEQDIANQAPLARAVILPFTSKSSATVRRWIRLYHPIDHGLLICVLHEDTDRESAEKDLMGLKHTTHGRVIHMSTRVPPKIAQRIANHDPGPGENRGVQVDGSPNEHLSFLLRRAFFDSESIRVEALTKGNTSSSFRAEVVSNGLAGPAPLPYFIKYDELPRLEIEKDHYRNFVEDYLPFNHRPNLIHKRCVGGHTHGILVGNFVENSISMETVAVRGTVHSAIHSLFHGALRGWRRQAFQDPNRTFSENPTLSILESLQQDSRLMVCGDLIPPNVQSCLEALGADSSYGDMFAQIRHFPKVRHLRGPIHRDLHIDNVHVHHSDSILLDFYGSGIGPLLWDPALLEVSLLFECEVPIDAEWLDEWNSLGDAVYSDTALSFPLVPIACSTRLSGILSAIQEIRMYAYSIEVDTGSYMQALVLAMMRIATFQPKEDVQCFRKAKALLTAQKLMGTIMGGNQYV